MQYRFFLSVLAIQIAFGSPPNYEIEYVHLIFSNHLDVGFTDTAQMVINTYFYDFFPQAILIGKAMAAAGFNYVYTTQAWLVSLYLNCPNQTAFPGLLYCPSQANRDDFIRAIQSGVITWHGFPFNVQFGAMDSEMIKFGVDLVHDLDQQFNLPLKRTVSQRDIPGLSVAALPPLVSKGIQAISVGVNGVSAPPAVPNIFIWKKPGSNESVIGMWHPGEYGGLNVSDAVIVPGLKHALIMNWRPDNFGPGTSEMTIEDFKYVQEQFPNAKVFASTFDSFLDVLLPFKDKLPIVQAEIGDTWIWGIQSDPLKMQEVRELMRLRKQYPVPFEFDRLFLKTFEHTWGSDPKRFSLDYINNWSNILFEAVRSKGWFQFVETSWREQRQYIQTAINTLPSALQNTFRSSLANLRPKAKDPKNNGFTSIPPEQMRNNFTCNKLQFQFSLQSGITLLRDVTTGEAFATYLRPIGQYIYNTFNTYDYNVFFRSYGYCYGQESCWYFPYDFGKPGLDQGAFPVNYYYLASSAHPANKTWTPQTASLWRKEDNNSCSFEQELTLPQDAQADYGAPKSIWVSYQFSKTERKISFNYALFSKTATRLPEAHWVLFNPQTRPTGNWKINVIESDIDPKNIVTNGSCTLWPQYDGIKYFATTQPSKPYIHIESLDAAFLSIGAPNPFPLLNTYLQVLENGFYFNLANNVWGTNFVLWYPFETNEEDKNILYRFVMTF